MSTRTEARSLPGQAASPHAARLGPNRGVRLPLPHLSLLALAGAACWAVVDLRINLATLIDGFHNAVAFAGRMLPLDFPPAADLVRLAGETLSMALCATLLSLLLSIPVSLLAARNLTPNRYLSGAARSLIVLARAVPDIILAIAAVRVFGLGATAGIIAMGLHSVGMVGKLYADALEETHDAPRRALRSAGASFPQELASAVLPQVLPSFIATALHRLDVNLRSSVLLGFVGVGGLGYEIAQSFQRLDYRRGMALAAVVLLLCLLMELLSGTIRRTLLRTPHPRTRRKPETPAGVTATEASAGTGAGTGTGLGAGAGAGLGSGAAPNKVSNNQMARRASPPPTTPPWTAARLRRWAYGTITAAVLIAAVRGAELSPHQLLTGLGQLPTVLGQYLPPTAPGGMAGLLDALWVTVKTALAGTLLGMVLALPVGVLAAHNVSPWPRLSPAFRTLTVAIRGIPEIVLAIVLVVITGLGPVAGALALAVGSLGFLGKLTADSLEELHPGPSRALAATGASRRQVFFAADFPRVLPALLGHVLYQLDVNIRSAALLGVVGAGGIGFELLNAARVLEYGLVTTTVLLLLATTLLLEAFSSWTRHTFT
ncbi:phosphonate ABC transporter, permease protein PhnE [Streptomyces sp. NPDC056361]|uniref:phosphonate ABC transporter, permease protein PhnE n=1 Tax=Streptomyces sp. NPDC056361 TaxID=3345795 RepID=UPI0035E03331